MQGVSYCFGLQELLFAYWTRHKPYCQELVKKCTNGRQSLQVGNRRQLRRAFQRRKINLFGIRLGTLEHLNIIVMNCSHSSLHRGPKIMAAGAADIQGQPDAQEALLPLTFRSNLLDEISQGRPLRRPRAPQSPIALLCRVTLSAGLRPTSLMTRPESTE